VLLGYSSGIFLVNIYCRRYILGIDVVVTMTSHIHIPSWKEIAYGDASVQEINELQEAVEAFLGHPDFPTIYNQMKTIQEIDKKWSFLMRRAYEVGQEVDIPIGNRVQNHHVKFKQVLEEYGLNLLCPFFFEDYLSATKEACIILDEEEVMTICHGKYHICDRFYEMTGKAVLGEVELSEKRRKVEVKYHVPEIKVEPVDLRDLDDWWKREGRYG